MVLSVPTVSEIQKDGTKIVNVYDSKNAVTRNIKVSAQEADEFIATRRTEVLKANRKDKIFQLGSVLVGTIGGLCVGLLNKGKPNYTKGSSTFIGFAGGVILAMLKGMAPSAVKADKKVTNEFVSKHSNKVNA